jgi:predicted nucleotide-binding protein (sugar kinase/HSP70/actin superfamily)
LGRFRRCKLAEGSPSVVVLWQVKPFPCLPVHILSASCLRLKM